MSQTTHKPLSVIDETWNLLGPKGIAAHLTQPHGCSQATWKKKKKKLKAD